MLITVFTPTYNRAHLLHRAYQSLLKQQSSDFEWLIVDDGSVDETERVVCKWIEESIFPIRYIKKENGGKHTAVNRGVAEAKGEFFAILDSDDQWNESTLAILKREISQLQPNHAGIIGLCGYTDGEIIGTNFPEHVMFCDFAKLYYKLGVSGDKSVLWRTALLTQFPFPEPEGIKFVSELTVWHPLSEQYPVRCINEIIEIKEYQELGLSDSSYKLWYLSSIAYTNFYLINANIHKWNDYPKVRWGEYVQLIINSKLAQTSYFNQLKWKDKIAYCLAYPRAFYSYLNMKKYVASSNQ